MVDKFMFTLVSILIFMFLSYGLFGVFANIALIINVTLIFGLLSIIGATLTLLKIAFFLQASCYLNFLINFSKDE